MLFFKKKKDFSKTHLCLWSQSTSITFISSSWEVSLVISADWKHLRAPQYLVLLLYVSHFSSKLHIARSWFGLDPGTLKPIPVTIKSWTWKIAQVLYPFLSVVKPIPINLDHLLWSVSRGMYQVWYCWRGVGDVFYQGANFMQFLPTFPFF